MSDSASEVGFGHLGLGSVLKQYHLTVPALQREYAWEQKHVETLFKDFARAIRERKSYFLGTVVTIPMGGDILEVVDGQQRLATTAILLSAIRDFIEPTVPMLAQYIDGEILSGIDTTVLARVPRLKLSLDDNEYFRARLTREGNVPATRLPSHELLNGTFEEARKWVASIVARWDPKDHGDTLNEWVNFIVSKAFVILVRVPNPSDAYRMFETLNDRGKRTSQSDLVKVYLFGRAGPRQPEVQQRWSYLRGALVSLSDDEDLTIPFLRHALTAIRGFVREADVFEAVQNHAQSEQQVVTFAGQLEDLANVYVAIHTTDHDRWNTYTDAARRALEVINLFGIATMRPLLLAIAHRFDAKEGDLAFRFLVSLSVRLMIAGGTRTSTAEEGLADAAHKLFRGNINSTDELKEHVKNITPSDVRFQQIFETAAVYSHKHARYYLRSLEMTAKGEPHPWLIPNDDRNAINLEHVLPQKPLDNWPNFSPELAKLFYPRIGNLALLRVSDNATLRSDPFSIKKPVLAKTPYLLTQQIAAEDEWTVEEITKRQKGLAAIALKTWPI